MIVSEILHGKFVRRYSDKGVMYDEAVDVLPCRYTYEETDELLESGDIDVD